jgi:hypothetical protein
MHFITEANAWDEVVETKVEAIDWLNKSGMVTNASKREAAHNFPFKNNQTHQWSTLIALRSS